MKVQHFVRRVKQCVKIQVKSPLNKVLYFILQQIFYAFINEKYTQNIVNLQTNLKLYFLL